MQENTKEIWRSVNGYSGLYEVSSEGRVRSLDRYVNSGIGIRLYKGRVLKPGIGKNGYLQVVLSKDNKQTTFGVHRLVWETFNGKRPEGMQVNHIDEDKTNNRLDNLNLMTPKQNVNWGTAIERMSKSLSKSIVQYDIQGNFLAEYPSQSEAERKLGICSQSISACCKGRYKTAGGFKWTYKEQ